MASAAENSELELELELELMRMSSSIPSHFMGVIRARSAKLDERDTKKN